MEISGGFQSEFKAVGGMNNPPRRRAESEKEENDYSE